MYIATFISVREQARQSTAVVNYTRGDRTLLSSSSVVWDVACAREERPDSRLAEKRNSASMTPIDTQALPVLLCSKARLILW